MRSERPPRVGQQGARHRHEAELTLASILPYFPRALRQPDGSYMVNCPAHDDRTPSLHLTERDGRLLWHCHAGCSQGAVRRELERLAGIRPARQAQAEREQPESRPEGLTLEAYARAKQLPIELLRQFGLEDCLYNGQPAIKIPFWDADGELRAVQYRLSLEGSDRFRWRRGDAPRLYGEWRVSEWLSQGKTELWAVEGCSDTLTMWCAGYACLGFPTASSTRLASDFWQIAQQFERVVLCFDSDRAGAELLEAVADACPRELVERVHMLRLPPNTKDVSELWCRLSGNAEQFREAVRQCERVPLASLTGLTVLHLNRESNCQTAPLVPVDLATRNPQPMEWLIENLVPARHTTNLYADSGSLKSYLALTIARAVLRGTDFAGYPVCRRGSVLYLDLELDDEEHTRRWWALARGAGEATPPNGLYYARVQSDLFAVWEHIEQLVRELSPVLVVVDSIGKAVGKPLDPDLAIRLYMLFDQLETAVLAIDHTPKPVAELPTEQMREYGTVYKRHYARSALQLDLQEKTQNRVGLLLRHQKSNFGRTVPEIPIVFEFVSEDGNLHTVRVLTNASAVQQEELFGERGAILAFLREQGEQGATIKTIAEALNLEDWKVRRYLKLLERSQLVVQVEGSYPHRYATLTSLTPSSKSALPENELNTEPSGGSLTVLHPYIESKCQTADVAPFDFSHRTPIEIPDDDPLERFLQQATADPMGMGLTPEEAETVRLLWCFAQARGFPRLVVQGVPAPFVIEEGQQAWLQALEHLAGTDLCQHALRALGSLPA